MFMGLVGISLLTGCRSPEFAYNTPPASLDPTGPSIVLLPLTDSRDNHDADRVFNKGYLVDMQTAIGRELESMRLFSSVTVANDPAHVATADYQVTPTLRRLDSELPHHTAVHSEKAVGHTLNFVVGGVTGIPVGSLFMLGGTPVCGNSAFDFAVRRAADQRLLLNATYSGTVTNRVKKTECDKPQTKATVMLAAFQTTQAEFKDDLLKQVLQDKYAKLAPTPAKK